MSSSTILVTGATGRVGARLIPVLRKGGHAVRIAVWAPGAPLAERGGMVMGDLTDPDVCAAAAEGVDEIVHIAAAFAGLTPQQSIELNALATGNLIAAAARTGAECVVQMSSYLVYAGDGSMAVTEDAPLVAHPSTSFCGAKIGAEQAVADAAGSPVRLVVLRQGFTYGEGDPHLFEAFEWAHGAAPEDRLHLVHHADVRQAIISALDSDASGVFNLADDEPADAESLLKAEPRFKPTGPATPADEVLGSDAKTLKGCRLDTARARTELVPALGVPSIAAADADEVL